LKKCGKQEKVELPLGKGTTFIKENSFDLVQLPAPEK